MDLGHAEKFESVKQNRATMLERYRRVMVETAQERVAVKTAEAWHIRCPRTTEGLRIKIQKVSDTQRGRRLSVW